MKPVEIAKAAIPVAEPFIGEQELQNVVECLRSGWISSLGRFVTEFEERFADFCNVKHGVATSNGTAALHLALLCLGVGPGDEVLVPSLTFVASANVILHAGATPVFVDSEKETWNLDPQDVVRKLTSKTKAILVVHLYGHPANMSPILEVAERAGVSVIEDAAEAHGALYNGRPVGCFGQMACFSFYGNKVITTGEGGILVTNDAGLAARAKHLRDHAMDPHRRYWHDEVGFNYRMTNIQAAIGVAQMDRVQDFIARKRSNAALYNSLLGGIASIRLPPQAEWARSIYWMYSILIDDSSRVSRNRLLQILEESGIGVRPFFYPAHVFPAFQKGAPAGALPVADDLSRRGLNLPSSVKLTEDDIRRVCSVIAEVV